MHECMHALKSKHAIPQESEVTILHIKLHITHTMTIIHAEHSPTMILARSCQDMANSQTTSRTHICGTSLWISTLWHSILKSHYIKMMNTTRLIHAQHVLTILNNQKKYSSKGFVVLFSGCHQGQYLHCLHRFKFPSCVFCSVKICLLVEYFEPSD